MIFQIHWPSGGGGGGGGAGGAIEDVDNEERIPPPLRGGGGALPLFMTGGNDDTWGEGGAGGWELSGRSDKAFFAGRGGRAFLLDSPSCLLAFSMPPCFSTKS